MFHVSDRTMDEMLRHGYHMGLPILRTFFQFCWAGSVAFAFEKPSCSVRCTICEHRENLVSPHGIKFLEAVVMKSSACVAIVAFLLRWQTPWNFGAISSMSSMIFESLGEICDGPSRTLAIAHSSSKRARYLRHDEWHQYGSLHLHLRMPGRVGRRCVPKSASYTETIAPARFLAGAAHLEWLEVFTANVTERFELPRWFWESINLFDADNQHVSKWWCFANCAARHLWFLNVYSGYLSCFHFI